MPNVEDEGQVTTTAAEVAFSTINANRTLSVHLDPAPLLAGDTIVITIYQKIRAGGGLVRFERIEVAGPRSDSIDSAPLPSPHQYEARIQRTLGVDRTLDFEVRSP